MAMAVIETWFDQDLNEAVKVHHLCGNVFYEDNGGNLVGVRLFKDGEPVRITESCIGYCVIANGASILVYGAVSGNKAYISIPAAAYLVPGPINIIIKLTNGSVVTTVCAVVSTVYGSGGITADPGQSTIDAWTAQINATIAAVQAGAVRFNASQSLTDAQKLTARNNIGTAATVQYISGNNYKAIIP
jgi:hypothetical protein